MWYQRGNMQENIFASQSQELLTDKVVNNEVDDPIEDFPDDDDPIEDFTQTQPPMVAKKVSVGFLFFFLHPQFFLFFSLQKIPIINLDTQAEDDPIDLTSQTQNSMSNDDPIETFESQVSQNEPIESFPSQESPLSHKQEVIDLSTQTQNNTPEEESLFGSLPTKKKKKLIFGSKRKAVATPVVDLSKDTQPMEIEDDPIEEVDDVEIEMEEKEEVKESKS